MPRSVHGYAYVYPFVIGGNAIRTAAFKLDHYIYVKPRVNSGMRPVWFRYHEDTTVDMIAFQPSKFYIVRF